MKKVTLFIISLVFSLSIFAEEEAPKKLDFANEDHFLFVFYIDGFLYRNEFMIDNNRQSYGLEYNKAILDFKEMNDLSYLVKGITEMLIPETKTAYSFNSFLYFKFFFSIRLSITVAFLISISHLSNN